MNILLNFCSLLFRHSVNAKRGLLRPTAAADMEHADKLREYFNTVLQPRSQESPDYRKDVIKAISQSNSNEDLTALDIIEYMDLAREKDNINPDNSRIRQPTGGDIFVFDVSTITIGCTKVMNDDGYSWTSTTSVGHDGLRKQSFYCRHPSENYKTSGSKFRKTIYYRDKDQTCLVHYRGDHEGAQPKLRYRTGLEKLASNFIIRRRMLEVDPERKMGPTQLRDEMMKKYPPDGFDIAVGHPQSRDQVRHYQRQLDKERQIGGCELINITYLAKIFGQDYVVNHSGHPHKMYFLAHEQSIANMKHLLKTLNDTTLPLLLHFDTTFQFGNYYLSPMVYRHPQLTQTDRKESEVQNPDAIIPLIHVLHENKSHASLENFFFWFKALMKKKCPKFLEQTKVLVSDREFKEEYMENTTRIYCKFHLLQDLERWGMQHLKMRKQKNMGTNNILYYVRSISDLMNCTTLEEYTSKRDDLFFFNKMWTSTSGKALQQYYKKNMEKDIIDRAGVWVLAKIGLGHLKNGLTNNASETYNSTIKHLKPRGNCRQTADITVIKLFSFESCLHNYVMAAYYGNGNVSLTYHTIIE